MRFAKTATLRTDPSIRRARDAYSMLCFAPVAEASGGVHRGTSTIHGSRFKGKHPRLGFWHRRLGISGLYWALERERPSY